MTSELEVADSPPTFATTNEVAGIQAEVEKLVEEEAAEKTDGVALSDETIKKIAEAAGEFFFDKTKKLITDLLDATEEAAEIAVEAGTTAATVATEEEGDEESTEEEDEDVKPKRGHRLFRKVGKKEE